jgi:uncharacterized protein YegL
MTRVVRVLVALAAAVVAVVTATAPAAAADDVLQSYKKRFTREAYGSDREDILRDLSEVGSPEAREAILWCLGKSREFIELAQKESDKANEKLRPFQEELDELYRRYAEQEAKRGNPNPTTVPAWPVIAKRDAARAELNTCERKVAAERAVRDTALDCHGTCLDKMPPAAQQAYAAKLAAGPLAAKEWAVRGEQYELLRASKAPWALQTLVDAVTREADPRALVLAIDGLAGRDATVVVPILARRLEDARWLVRAAALSALERTPCRETVDVVLARFPKEEGRLRDDCARILKALTGAAVPATPEALKQWWDANRTGWTGPPAERKGLPDANRVPEEIAKDAGKTGGFFGVETSSKRLCFVIDLSGSMNEKAVDKGKESRADMAKAELARAIKDLADGTTFSLVLFASDVRVWKKEMTVAGDETRKAAIAFAEASPVIGATNTYGALEAAFAIGEPLKAKGSDAYADPLLDTIVFLSDGKPTHGRTLDTKEIRAAVREWNKRRRVTVHAIAFGKDADFDFMKGLATDTGGKFVSP